MTKTWWHEPEVRERLLSQGRELLAQGKSWAEIGRAIGINEITTRFHLDEEFREHRRAYHRAYCREWMRKKRAAKKIQPTKRQIREVAKAERRARLAETIRRQLQEYGWTGSAEQ